MKLHAVKRTAKNKCEAKKLRREGLIPAVLYVKGKEGETLAVPANEFNAIVRDIKPGHLPTTIFTLIDEQGHKQQVVVKEIQYQVTTYAVIHLDFEALVDTHKINVKIPIECIGLADCVGVKLGGVLRQVIRHIPVQCFPKDLPSYFELNVQELGLRQSKRLKDLQMPDAVRPLTNLEAVVAAVVKR